MLRRNFLKGLLASGIGSLVIFPSFVNEPIDYAKVDKFSIGEWKVRIDERIDMCNIIQVYASNNSYHFIKIYDNGVGRQEMVDDFLNHLKIPKRSLRNETA